MRFLYDRVYGCLLRLHPRRFRERFGEEMACIFEEASATHGSARLLGDALLSLFRQWVRHWAFRPEPQPAAAAKPSGDTPAFYTFDTYTPRRMALIQGGVLSAIFFWTLVFAATNGAHSIKFLIGSPDPRSAVLSLTRSSLDTAPPDVTVRVPSVAVDPWYDFASQYFKIIYVLEALDADHDYVISAAEISAASAALQKLDLNADGKLTAEECGMCLGPGCHSEDTVRDADQMRHFRAAFMAANPVLTAIDTDRDAAISASEIQNAAVALKRLDLNGDGKLLPVEVAPVSVLWKILMNNQ